MAKLKPLLVCSILVMILSITAITPYVYGSVEVTEDFEDWNSNHWKTLTQNGGIVDVPNATASRSGSYGAFFYDSSPATSSVSNIYRENFTGRWEYYVDYRIRFTNISVVTQTYMLLIQDNEQIDKFSLQINEGVNFTIQQTIDSNFSISMNKWYRITCGFRKDNSTGFRKLWIDGTLYISQSNIDTDTTGRNITQVWFCCGTFAGGQTIAHIDDVIISTTQPSFEENEEYPYDPSDWIVFFIGLIGLGLIFISWLVAKDYWSQGLYAEAIGYWLALFLIGIGFLTVLVGG